MADIRNGAKRHQFEPAPRIQADAKADGKAAAATPTDAPKKSKATRRRERKEKAGKGVKYILVAIGVAAMVLSVSTVACAGILNQSQSTTDYHLTGGVAATVDGVNITEDTITKYIMSTRTSQGYDSDEDWAQYLVDSGLTPESYRENAINSYARQYLLTKAIDEYDITVSDDEVEEAWQKAAKGYDSEQDFIDTLTSYGMTEDSYKESLKSDLEQQKLYDKVAPVDEPSDDDIVEYMNEHLSSYNDARRSSHILIKVADDADDETRADAQAKAQDILDQINAGEISFADAAKKYSEDSSADDGGDVGWDKLTTFVTSYQDALSALDTGQVSGVVESDYGYHIIMCTDRFNVSGQVSSIDEIPEAFQEEISDTIASTEQQTAYNEWLDQYVEDADIEINPMPEDVPYNVSLDDVTPTSEQDAADGSSADGTDAAATDNAAAASDDAAATE